MFEHILNTKLYTSPSPLGSGGCPTTRKNRRILNSLSFRSLMSLLIGPMTPPPLSYSEIKLKEFLLLKQRGLFYLQKEGVTNFRHFLLYIIPRKCFLSSETPLGAVIWTHDFFFISVGNPSGVKILVSFRQISCLGNGFCLPQTPSRMGLFQMEVFIIIIVTDGRMDVQEYVFILTGNVPLQKNLTFLFKKSKINKNIFSHKLGLGVLCRLFKFIFAKISKTHLYFFLIASRPLGKLVNLISIILKILQFLNHKISHNTIRNFSLFFNLQVNSCYTN